MRSAAVFATEKSESPTKIIIREEVRAVSSFSAAWISGVISDSGTIEYKFLSTFHGYAITTATISAICKSTQRPTLKKRFLLSGLLEFISQNVSFTVDEFHLFQILVPFEDNRSNRFPNGLFLGKQTDRPTFFLLQKEQIKTIL